MTWPDDAFAAALKIAKALESRNISYALGGAHAYGQYGIPRATNDVVEGGCLSRTVRSPNARTA